MVDLSLPFQHLQNPSQLVGVALPPLPFPPRLGLADALLLHLLGDCLF